MNDAPPVEALKRSMEWMLVAYQNGSTSSHFLGVAMVAAFNSAWMARLAVVCSARGVVTWLRSALR